VRRPASSLITLAAIVALGAAAPTVPATADDGARLGPKVAPFVPRPSDDDRLVAASERWAEAGVDHYRTTVVRGCECPPQPAVRTEVRGGRLVSVRDREHDRSLPWQRGRPVERLFRIIRHGYRSADAVSVVYGSRGVPRSVVIDWSFTVADEETVLSVRFRSLD
jgi:hypothetical protein